MSEIILTFLHLISTICFLLNKWVFPFGKNELQCFLHSFSYTPFMCKVTVCFSKSCICATLVEWSCIYNRQVSKWGWHLVKEGIHGQKEKPLKNKLWSTKHCTVNKISSNTNSTKNRIWTQMLWKDEQLIFHMWHPSCWLKHW
jgi:hypothetical protein